MKAFWAKITAFFMAIVAFFTGLFAGGNKPDPQPQPEPTSQVTVMPTEPTTEPEPPTPPDVPASVIIYQAHRGFSSAYPENTLAAFRAAGCDARMMKQKTEDRKQKTENRKSCCFQSSSS
ncbi:MAG: hypothetical protein II804_08995 [Clostridia bacterium]|nr:hypothetical protein [Clostridia bacterium]